MTRFLIENRVLCGSRPELLIGRGLFQTTTGRRLGTLSSPFQAKMLPLARIGYGPYGTRDTDVYDA